MTSDLLAAAVVVCGLGGAAWLADALRRCRGLSAEGSRKLVHLVGGLLALGMPWYLRSPLVVIALGAVASLGFHLTRRLGVFPSIHAVGRRTAGGEYYPLAVALTFLISEGRPWLFVPSVLVLAVADAFAALIGSRFGRHRFLVEDEQKSLEGSLAFFAIAVPAVAVPAALWTSLPPQAILLASFYVAALVTGFEIVSLRGSDNLFVPIGVCVILEKIAAQPLREIVYQLTSLLAILVCGGFVARRTRSFNVGGALTALLFCYGVWSLASERWAISALFGVFAYGLARRLLPAPPADDRPVRVRIVFRAVAVPFLVVVSANAFGLTLRWGPVFGVTAAVAMAQSLGNHASLAVPAPPWRNAVFLALAGGATAAPLLLASAPAWWPAGTGLVTAGLAANALYRRLRGARPDPWGAFQMGLEMMIAALSVLAIHAADS